MTRYLMTLGAWSALHLVWQGWVILGAWMLLRGERLPIGPTFRYRIALGLLATVAVAPFATAVATHLLISSEPASIAITNVFGGKGDPGGESGLALLFDNWAPAIGTAALVWAIGTGALLTRFALGLWRLARIGGGDIAASENTSLHARTVRLSNQAGLSAPPSVAIARNSSSPMVFGHARPILLLSAGMLASVKSDELDAILLHELAHIRRRDFSVNAAQTVVEALFWFHPAVWILSGAIRIEREQCCDAEAVRNTKSPFPLARALLRIETTSRHPLAVAAHGGELRTRVEAILSSTQPTSVSPASNMKRSIAAAAVAMAIAASVPLAANSAIHSESLLWSGISSSVIPGSFVRFDASDPAGPFQVSVINGHVSSVRLDGARVPSSRVRQRRDSVSVLARTGSPLFSFELDHNGTIRWSPRARSVSVPRLRSGTSVR